MTNNLKKAIGTLVGIGIGATAVGIGYGQYKKATVNQWLKKLVIKTWESEDVQASVRKLGLKEQPTLTFEKLDHAIMLIKYEYYSDLFIVKKTVPEYTIYIDLNKLYKELTNVQLMSLNYGSSIQKSVIKMLLLHECRHIAQAQGNFYIGKSTIKFNLGHGEKEEELDANEFAVSQAKDKHEKALFEFLKAEQEYHPLYSKSEIIRTSKNVRKHYNPLAILFK